LDFSSGDCVQHYITWRDAVKFGRNPPRFLFDACVLPVSCLAHPSTLIMESVQSLETLKYFYPTARCYRKKYCGTQTRSINISRCYVAPAAYACAVTSHSNTRGDAGGVFIGPLRGYMTRSTVFCWASECSAVESSAEDCSPVGNGSWRISIAKIRYQETSSGDIAEE
jgi:hypothetical protein